MKEFLASSAFFGSVLTLAAYALGLFIRDRVEKSFINPLLVAILTVVAFLLISRTDAETYVSGANIISYFLTPATVCLAVPLYRQLTLLRRYPRAIAAGITAGVLTNLAGIFLLALAFGLTHEQYVTLLPKSITTAIGMGVSEELGGIVTVTVSAIILTGLTGNLTAGFVCRLFRLRDPVAKGIGIGTASHAIGTSRALEMGEAEGAMAGLSIAVTGLLTVVGASIFAHLL